MDGMAHSWNGALDEAVRTLPEPLPDDDAAGVAHQAIALDSEAPRETLGRAAHRVARAVDRHHHHDRSVLDAQRSDLDPIPECHDAGVLPAPAPVDQQRQLVERAAATGLSDEDGSADLAPTNGAEGSGDEPHDELRRGAWRRRLPARATHPSH